MRDAYPIALFALGHVLELLERLFGEAVNLLPWSLVFCTLLSEKLSKILRVFIVGVALLFSVFFEQISHRFGEEPCCPYRFSITLSEDFHLNEQGIAGAPVDPLKRITLVRVMDTIIALISAELEFDLDIPLDRTSTHPLENFLPLLRRLLYDYNIFDELLHAAAKNSVIHQIGDELAHSRGIYGRLNFGGIPSRSEARIDIIASFAASHILEGIIFSLYIPALLDQPDNELENQCTIYAFDWIMDLQNRSVTTCIEKGS
jgi:hypothetical protein